MMGDKTAITSATTSSRMLGSSTHQPMIKSRFAITTPRTPCTIVRARRQYQSLLARNSFVSAHLSLQGLDVVLRDSHVLLEPVGALQDLVVLLDLCREGVRLTSMTARLLELERITPTSVTTPVMHATMIDSIKNCLPRSRLSSPGRQCPPVSQAVQEACLSAMS